MPITLTNGLPQGPNSLIVPNGSIGFQLNVDATVIAAPFGFVSGSFEVVFQFDSAGLIQPNSPSATAQIYSNAELNPQNSIGLGTYYLVTFYDANGGRINKLPMWWQFPEAAGATVNISNMTAISTVGGNVIFYPTNFAGGGGTVTSVSITGDGTIFSSTPSSPVTTTGTLTPTLLPQNANLVLAGPTTGSAAAPTFRALTTADLPATVNIWNLLANATGNLVLTNTTFNTTFNQTSAAVWTWANTSAATALANQNSPALVLSGQVWDSVHSLSATNTYTIQNKNGALLFTTSQGVPVVQSYVFDANVEILSGLTGVGGAALVFATGSSGAVYPVTSVANAVGNLTTYQYTAPSGGQPQGPQNLTVAGFVAHAGNNGTFVVQSATLTTVTVYSSAGVAETHAATATVDGVYIGNQGQSGFSYANGNVNLAQFPIAGVSYGIPNQFSSTPTTPSFTSIVKGDSVDAGYWRHLNDGATGNHGLEIGSIIDGTGAAPVTLQIGKFNGIASFALSAPISKYNGIATVSGGVPAEYATVDLTAQTAAVGTTTLYAVPAAGAGQYRLNWDAKVTTAAGSSSTLGALTITYTDPDSVVQTITCGAQIAAGSIATTSTGNTNTTVLLGLPLVLNCKASTNIQYAFGYASNAANAMNYNLHLKLESL